MIPGSERSPGEGNGNPPQYSCLRIPWTEEPGGLQSMGLQRLGHDIATTQQQRVNKSEVVIGYTAQRREKPKPRAVGVSSVGSRCFPCRSCGLGTGV